MRQLQTDVGLVLDVSGTCGLGVAHDVSRTSCPANSLARHPTSCAYFFFCQGLLPVFLGLKLHPQQFNSLQNIDKFGINKLTCSTTQHDSLLQPDLRVAGV